MHAKVVDRRNNTIDAVAQRQGSELSGFDRRANPVVLAGVTVGELKLLRGRLDRQSTNKPHRNNWHAQLNRQVDEHRTASRREISAAVGTRALGVNEEREFAPRHFGSNLAENLEHRLAFVLIEVSDLAE